MQIKQQDATYVCYATSNVKIQHVQGQASLCVRYAMLCMNASSAIPGWVPSEREG